MAAEPIVVIGGGLAAARVAQSYREAGGEGELAILSSDDAPPYNRPPLSKGILRGELEPADALIEEEAWYAENVVDLRLRTEVESIDVEARSVGLAGGGDMPYGTLVIAAGARPRVLPIPGIDLTGVHTYRRLADAIVVREAAADARRALVIGGSFIGSEVAASLRRRGLEVTLIETGERLMPAFSSAELSAQLADLYREEGVELLLGDSIEELRGNGRLLTGARTASGVDVEAYLAVVGVGVQPNVEIVEGTGIEVDNGIVVDERFRTSVEGVYAVGDVARFPDPVFGRQRRIEHWTNASAQGAHLGAELAGSRKAYDEMSVFFTELFGFKLQVIGDLDGGVDEMVLRGSVADRQLLGFYLRDGRLIGAVVAGQTADVVEELKTLVREQPEVSDLERLQDEGLRPTAAVAS
jgi:NADPH-dependent 2,4-dienoyl-CoA reductase/sulfur reductase-like enzyme